MGTENFFKIFCVSVERRKSKLQTPVHADGEKPPRIIFTIVLFYHYCIMEIKTDFAKVRLIEITDGLKERNREKREGQPLTTGYRIVIAFTDDELSEDEKAMLAKVKDDAKRALMEESIKSNRTEIRFSGVFNCEDILKKDNGEPFVTPEGGFTDEQQDALAKAVAKKYADMGNENIFSVATASISELLKGTEHDGVTCVYAENSNGATSMLTEQNRIFFGFFTDKESALNMMRRSLLARIVNHDVELTNDATNDKQDDNPLANVV